jgi:hypothetical protein
MLLGESTVGAQQVPVDRAVVRFSAAETGGLASPRFIFERVLAFEARIEALADATTRGVGDDGAGYNDRHVRAAMERHISETLLASRRVEPEPTADELAARTDAARRLLIQRVGGAQRLEAARRAEGLVPRELLRVVRRQARASLYLDRMVQPMLAPSDAELKRVLLTARTPFHGRPFDEVQVPLRRWYVSQKFAAALGGFYQNVRSRLKVRVLRVGDGS